MKTIKTIAFILSFCCGFLLIKNLRLKEELKSQQIQINNLKENCKILIAND